MDIQLCFYTTVSLFFCVEKVFFSSAKLLLLSFLVFENPKVTKFLNRKFNQRETVDRKPHPLAQRAALVIDNTSSGSRISTGLKEIS